MGWSISRSDAPPEAAGTTHKVLLYHFASADDLLVQAVLQLRDRRKTSPGRGNQFRNVVPGIPSWSPTW